jgi:hypothetical protein
MHVDRALIPCESWDCALPEVLFCDPTHTAKNGMSVRSWCFICIILPRFQRRVSSLVVIKGSHYCLLLYFLPHDTSLQ